MKYKVDELLITYFKVLIHQGFKMGFFIQKIEVLFLHYLGLR